jgi:hypothetical protein
MRLFILTTLLLLAATATEAQLAEFETKGFEDSRWTCKVATIEDGKPVTYILPNCDGDYKVYGEYIEWEFYEYGTYIITQRHNDKEVYLTLIVTEDGVDTKKVYSLKRRNKYVG